MLSRCHPSIPDQGQAALFRSGEFKMKMQSQTEKIHPTADQHCISGGGSHINYMQQGIAHRLPTVVVSARKKKHVN